jgi:four helix bundle protein
VQDFKKLEVWQLSHVLTVNMYRCTKGFPDDERYGLISQIRRAAISIEANIAEGCGRNTKMDFARFLQQAMGSAAELECHLLICKDLGMLGDGDFNQYQYKTVQIKRMLTALIDRARGSVLPKTENRKPRSSISST